MPRKKAKRKVYFGQEVQDAIIEYNSSTSSTIRNEIYQYRIHKAFDKLAENIINTFKFTYFDYGFEDIKHEVVAFMVVNMHKYDHTKGSKAFSYFSVVAKNYLILHNNNNYKKLKSHYDLEVLDDEYTKNYDFDKKNNLKEFTGELLNYFRKEIPNIFKKKRDIEIATALIEIIKDYENIENFNKKFIYILVRELTNVKTTDITRVTNIFKKYYKTLLYNYETNGYIKQKKSVFEK